MTRKLERAIISNLKAIVKHYEYDVDECARRRKGGCTRFRNIIKARKLIAQYAEEYKKD